MRKSLVLGTLSLTMLVGLPACGDDSGSSEADTSSGTESGDGDGDTATDEGMSAEESTGDGDGDSTTGDGDGDSTTGDGDGDSTTGDGDGDGDGDGTTGDGDGDGNCFSTLVSTENTMMTSLTVQGLVSCSDVPINIVATGGSICTNDDGSGGLYYTIQSIEFEDVPPMSCGLAMLGLENLSIANNGDSTEVTVPAGGGDMTGNQSIVVLGDAYGSALGNDIAPTPIDGFEGSLPEGNATVGADTSVSYANTSHQLAQAMPEIDGPIGPVQLTVTLTGLTGSLTFDP